jgi:cytochrome P450
MVTTESPGTRADDWDPSAADPLGEQARMRRECPVAWTNRLGAGAWAITRYDDASAAARDTRTFSSRNEPRLGPVPSPPIEVDRPEHTVCRRLLAPYFDKRRMTRWSRLRNLAFGASTEPLLGKISGWNAN